MPANSADQPKDDLMPAQREVWGAPKISLMETGDTDGTGKFPYADERTKIAGPS